MLVESTELVGRQVYTPDGRLLGEVGNLVIDVEGSKVDGIFLDEPSPLLVEESRPINIPYRWVSAVNDVVLLRFFPKRVSMKKAPSRATPKEAVATAAPAPAPAR
ncbi:MAG TPA: PRC-barrel domain-containing protein [Thermoplasmata archaeon]|nr:PRC-barrel domain-containing protein [Thermoplasmata archaeon]